MNDKKAESTKSYETIKLGIDAHSKWQITVYILNLTSEF